MFSLATVMQIFTKDVSSLTSKYDKKREKVDKSFTNSLRARLKLNNAAIKGIEQVEVECAKEKASRKAENQLAKNKLKEVESGH